MWRMLQQPGAEDYVVATGTQSSVRDFLEACFEVVGLKWQDHIEFDPRFMRPSDVQNLVGNPKKSYEKLGWQSSKSLSELARQMMNQESDNHR